MPKLFPTEQKLVDVRGGEVIAISRVVAVGVNDNYVVLPSIPVDARIVSADNSVAQPAFYLGQNANTSGSRTTNIFNIDGTSAGTEFLVVSRHRNIGNRSV